ncbi:MAG: hypothetical protein IKQ87_04085 [Clostridia bacterium]|nr:hypothetical protein [Clostridia bacterium]
MFEQVLKMVRARLNRMYAGGTYAETDGFDEYVRMRCSAAEDEMLRMGIRLDGSPSDIMLLADYVCWQYANRDKGDDDPAWLRRRLRDRWIKEGVRHDS